MRNAIIIGVLCVLALAGGAWLYFRSTVPVSVEPTATTASVASPVAVPVTVLDRGANATAYAERKNYAIYDPAMFREFWTKVHGSASGMPSVDFSKNYVIAVFAGKEPTGGYAISVDRVTDAGGSRAVDVSITAPGQGCQVAQAQSAPYEFVSVPLSGGFTLSHADHPDTADCK